MRVIIEPNYELASKWAANYVAKKINESGPTDSAERHPFREKPFVLGFPTGSSPRQEWFHSRMLLPLIWMNMSIFPRITLKAIIHL